MSQGGGGDAFADESTKKRGMENKIVFLLKNSFFLHCLSMDLKLIHLGRKEIVIELVKSFGKSV